MTKGDDGNHLQHGIEVAEPYESDLDRVSGALASIARGERPGIATLFVYKARKKKAFFRFAKRLAAERDLGCRLYSIPHGGSYLVALLYSKLLPQRSIEEAVEEIEDMALTAAMQTGECEYVTREAIMDILEGRS